MGLPLAMTFIVKTMVKVCVQKTGEITHNLTYVDIKWKTIITLHVGETTINICQDPRHSNGELHAHQPIRSICNGSVWAEDTKFSQTMTARRRCASMCSQVFLVNFSKSYFIAIYIYKFVDDKNSAFECAMHRWSGCCLWYKIQKKKKR